MNFKSEPAQFFYARFGRGVNDHEQSLLHELAGESWKTPHLLRDFCYALRHGWSPECADCMGNTVLDEAIDSQSYTLLEVLLQEPLSTPCLVQVIGNLLSNYYHMGSPALDAAILACICKAGTLSHKDCSYLLKRALHGAAWPYLLPLREGAAFPAQTDLHWEKELALYVDERQLGCNSFFSQPEQLHDYSLLGFCSDSNGIRSCVPAEQVATLARQLKHPLFLLRRPIKRQLKQMIRKDHLRNRDVVRLMRLFLPS